MDRTINASLVQNSMDGRDNISVEEWMERKLWTPGCVYGETCFLFETVAAIFPAGFPLTLVKNGPIDRIVCSRHAYRPPIRDTNRIK